MAACERIYPVIYLLTPTNLTPPEKKQISNWCYNGFSQVEAHTWQGTKYITTHGRHVWSYSHLDAIDSVKQGAFGSMLIIVNGGDIGTGLYMDWIQENYPEIFHRCYWVNTEETIPLHWGMPVKEPWVTVPLGYFNARRDYANHLHEGRDFVAQGDQRIYASNPGIVERVKTPPFGKYGLYVRLRHDFAGEIYTTWYCHLAEAYVNEGDIVSRGQILGLQGNSGGNFGLHLHFNICHIGKGLDGYVIDDVIDPEIALGLKEPETFPLALPADDEYCVNELSPTRYEFINSGNGRYVFSAADGFVERKDYFNGGYRVYIQTTINERPYLLHYTGLGYTPISEGDLISRDEAISDTTRDFEFRLWDLKDEVFVPLDTVFGELELCGADLEILPFDLPVNP